MLRILHTNDFHGALNAAREEELRELRSECDVYFDCGDAIKAGNLAIPLKPEEVWGRLAELRCTASVPGNRESHILQSAFAKKLEGARHPILCANLRLKSGERPLPGHLVIEAAGLRVGVVGVMVPMITERMATQAASAYLWDQPIPTAVAEAEKLRPEVDCLIALTHIGLRNDRELAARCDLFDLILGGHSHDVLTEPAIVGRTAICQTGSHGRYAGRYDWAPGGLADYRLVAL
ncbi:MAG TPA: metallophosphoesterase [Fimbriimonadaceae bacterium]|nr:metallophosphoesterase [Fimbriimonadaceae bacterium]